MENYQSHNSEMPMIYQEVQRRVMPNGYNGKRTANEAYEHNSQITHLVRS